MSLNAGLNEARDEATIELHEADRALGHITLDASGLEELIHRLGEIRQQMTDEVPTELDPQFRIQVVHQPAWRVPEKHNGPKQTAMLVLRHPGLGWLAFHLEQDRAASIAKHIVEYSK